MVHFDRSRLGFLRAGGKSFEDVQAMLSVSVDDVLLGEDWRRVAVVGGDAIVAMV